MNLTQNEIITAAIALYAALLATFTFIVQQMEKRGKIRVSLSLGFVARGQEDPVDVVSLEAANHGNVPVHLSSCHLNLPHTKEKLIAHFHFDKDFPITLNPGESIQAWLESHQFIEIVRKNKSVDEIVASAEFSNKGNGVFRSKPQNLNLKTMLFAKEQSSKNAA